MDLQTKCEECGADLSFKPGTKHLTCTYCDHKMAFAEAESIDQAHTELNLDDYIDNFDANTQHIERHVVDCQGCGAETELEENQQSALCPFCDAPLILQQSCTKKTLKPAGVLPFSVEKSQARENFKQWLSKLWFAPNDLKKQITQQDKFKGIYLPFWTYDCDTYSYYTGQRGIYYYETVSRTDSDGNTTSKEERRTRWSYVSGEVYNSFDDILVPASNSLAQDKLNALEPWDLHQLVDYKDEYLSGYLTETYQVSLRSGYESAKNTMDSRIHREIERHIGGDDQQVDSVETRYMDATFKHILLPVWISAYRYRDKLYQILVNARTGEVQGMRPYSWIKITLAIIVLLAVVSVLVYFFMLEPEAERIDSL
ncbi:Primosomal protein N' (replication factor Y) -superfamily II helicase [hydrothermal vent metagenome]|uniref:Primosomal protein N' (Replication factor Y) -superfamily II helicase n=1 Tax=hydrothermal vent metagenome TaxID=652676 RepID=A0A3B0XWR2_9ZZZZ